MTSLASSLARLYSVVIRRTNRLRYMQCQLHTGRCARQDNLNPDDPIRYSTSDAHRWKTIDSFTVQRQAPLVQVFSVLASTSAFLLYFLVLREENDLDEQLALPLYEHVPGMEEKQLQLRISYDKERGNNTTAMEARLRQLRAQRDSEADSSAIDGSSDCEWRWIEVQNLTHLGVNTGD